MNNIIPIGFTGGPYSFRGSWALLYINDRTKFVIAVITLGLTFCITMANKLAHWSVLSFCCPGLFSISELEAFTTETKPAPRDVVTTIPVAPTVVTPGSTTGVGVAVNIPNSIKLLSTVLATSYQTMRNEAKCRIPHIVALSVQMMRVPARCKA